MDGSHVRETVKSLIGQVRSIANDLTVGVVSNIKGRETLSDDYDGTSVSTEYFSEDEISQILIGLQENGFFTKLYVGEREFIRDVLDLRFESLPRSRKIIYNAAQSGIGPGRKSLMPAFCMLHGIAICNSNAYVVSLARHKFHVSCILAALGIPVAKSWLFDANSGWLLNGRPPAHERLIAKACYESASIGLTQRSLGEMSDMYEATLREISTALNQPVIVQKFIDGSELEIPLIDFGHFEPSAIGPVAIAIDGDPNLGSRILDYDRIAFDEYEFAEPLHLDASVLTEAVRIAKASFRILGMRCFGRIDGRVDRRGNFFVTDVSTSPHLVRHSSFAYGFRRMGFAHGELLGALIAVNAVNIGWISPSTF